MNAGQGIPQNAQTSGSESELGKQLQQFFYETSRTGELVKTLEKRLHVVLRPETPTPQEPSQANAQLHPLLSPLSDSLKLNGIQLMEVNDFLQELINRLAV